MFNLSQDFHRARRERNRAPVVLFSLINAFGMRVYARRHPQDEHMGLIKPTRADSLFLADGSRRAGEGALSLLERGARVLSLGRLRETLTPLGGDLLASLRQEEPGSLTVVLSNGPAGEQRPFSRLEALENLLGAVGELTIGYPGVLARDYLRRFKGKVVAYRLEDERLTLNLKAV